MKSENKKKDFYYDCDAFNILFTICGCSKDKDKDISKKQLYTFICNLNMQGVKEALKNHAEFAKETIKTSSKTKPLELAVREIESEKVQLQICSQLIKSGADVNEKGDEITALKGTVSRIPFENYNEKMDMLNRLLESGAKPDSDIISFLLNDDNSNWGMQYYFTPQILKKLEKYDGKQNISQGLRAAMNGDDHKLQKLVISDKINKKDKEQVLAFAAAHCNVDTLKIMRKQGYDFSWKDSDKVGLLQIAALCNHSSVVKYLLEQQLNSKAKADYYKVRAVEFAIVAGNLDNAKILIEKDKVNFKKNHHGKPCDVWEFILAFGDKKSFKTLESLGHQPTKEEIYDTYQNYGKEQYEQGVKVKEDEVRQYSYDANGNQTDVKNTKTGQTESYTYDAENRLSKVSVTDKDGKTAVIQQNRYNGDGQRIQKVEGSKTTNYYYQDGVVSYTTDGDNIQTSQNLIGTDGNILATQRYGSDHTDYLLYHKDIQGSSTSLVKEDGSADATYQYTDFGETTINGDNKAENEVCYTGGIYDQSTGLYYLNARYYNPEDGGFLTEDTYRGEINEPETQNLYVYCADNPVNYVDPSGHKYDKDKAINYAHNHYLNYNKKYNRHPKDCTNFVSQCVHAGGKKMKYKNYKKILQYKDMYKTTSYWYSHRYEKWRTNYYVYKWKETSAWVGVEDFCKYWRKHEAKITVTSILNKMQNKAVRGDVVQFYVKSKGWYHSTIVTAGKKGALKYCAHSNSRRDYKYSLLTKNNAEKYRIIHFK